MIEVIAIITSTSRLPICRARKYSMTGYCWTHWVFARTNSSWAASLIFNTSIATSAMCFAHLARRPYLMPSQPGLHHLCLRVDTPADVAAVAAQLRGAGIAATDAKLYPIYAPDYWATYFTDPDGIRLAVTNFRQERRKRHDNW